MHELSIVDSLIKQVEEEVGRSGHAGQVTRLQLTIGRLSGVNVDSVRFAFEILAPGTLVENVKVDIAEPKPTCCCRTCGARVEVDDLVAECPKCAGGDLSIEGGRDLLLESIELEDQPMNCRTSR